MGEDGVARGAISLPADQSPLLLRGGTDNGGWRVVTTPAISPNADDQVLSLLYNCKPAPSGGSLTRDVNTLGCISFQLESHFGYNDTPGHATVSPNAEWDLDFYNPTNGGWARRELAFLYNWATGATSWKFGTGDGWGFQLDGSAATFGVPTRTPSLVIDWPTDRTPMTSSTPGVSYDADNSSRTGIDSPGSGKEYLRSNIVRPSGGLRGHVLGHGELATPDAFVDDFVVEADDNGARTTITGPKVGQLGSSPFVPRNLTISDSAAYAANVGGSIGLCGRYNSAGDYACKVALEAVKDNSTNGDSAFGVCLSTGVTGTTQTTHNLCVASDGATTIGSNATSPTTISGPVTAARGSFGSGVSANTAVVRVHSESTTSAPSTYAGFYGLVVGKTGDTDPAAFIAYNTTGDTAVIGSLAPSVAWKPLLLSASTIKIGSLGTGISNSIRCTATLATAEITNGTTVAQDIACTNVAVGAECTVGGPATLEAGLIQSCVVTSAGHVGLRTANVTAAPITPAGSQTVSVRAFNP